MYRLGGVVDGGDDVVEVATGSSSSRDVGAEKRAVKSGKSGGAKGDKGAKKKKEDTPSPMEEKMK